MRRAGPIAELRNLERFVREVESRYIAPHLSNVTLGAPSRAEVLDVAAFVVLVHGAFENFVEGLGYWLVGRVEHSWLTRRRTSRSTASLLLHYTGPFVDPGDTRNVFDNIRISLTTAKTETAKLIGTNNGIAPRHLRAILRPLGVDVPNDPILIASLDMLVSMRHAWAHQYRYGAVVPKSAADAKQTSDDCLQLAQRLAINASRAKP